MGFYLAGYNLVFSLEQDKWAADTLRQNGIYDLVVEAVNELQQVSQLYAQALKLVKGGLTTSERIKLVEILQEIANHEEKAGELLLEFGKHYGS